MVMSVVVVATIVGVSPSLAFLWASQDLCSSEIIPSGFPFHLIMTSWYVLERQ
jgi:hypothetical protein